MLEVKSQGMDLKEKESLLPFLAMRFTPASPPGGFVHLIFAGGAQIKLKVEALDIHFHDLDESWETPH